MLFLIELPPDHFYLLSILKLRSDYGFASSHIVNFLFASTGSEMLQELILNSGHVVTHHLRDLCGVLPELKFDFACQGTPPTAGHLANHITPSTKPKLAFLCKPRSGTCLIAMAGSPSSGKRKLTAPVSPPPLRQKVQVQSGTTRKSS